MSSHLAHLQYNHLPKNNVKNVCVCLVLKFIYLMSKMYHVLDNGKNYNSNCDTCKRWQMSYHTQNTQKRLAMTVAIFPLWKQIDFRHFADSTSTSFATLHDVLTNCVQYFDVLCQSKFKCFTFFGTSCGGLLVCHLSRIWVLLVLWWFANFCDAEHVQ